VLRAPLVLMVVMFIAAMVCIIRANIIFYQIVDGVNAKCRLRRQISFIFVNFKMFDIQSQHQAFFPFTIKKIEL
jgi:hypothetical protein